ncbi:helix-turn-helix domain-containing protein [Clostridium psychrophilum]|uniref:helix-turn-helix domain-containing protein n=1 Tax=Clostridium psychrophilum TaxID=132926 RepID=UPI001C0CD5C4|nr:AraC family transcriptional regulator [Clostridium psychrophilum]MBU3182055.1 AraC family transcriptional regulator [Clostridium psychrophilum]
MNDDKLKEKTARGDSIFPLHVYSHIDTQGNYSVSDHWHNEIEVVYIEEGDLMFNIDMQHVKLTHGQCVFINSEQLHSIYAIDNKPSIHHSIVFDINILNSSIYNYYQNKYINPIIKKSLSFPLYLDTNYVLGNKTLNEILEIIDVYHRKSSGCELSIKGCLLKIVANLFEEDKFIKNDSAFLIPKDYKVRIIKKVLGFIDNNYTQKIYISELAAEANMNTQYFCRFFKSVTGKTAVTYINKYRIERAAKMLKTEDTKEMQVCFDVGFSNFSYFIKKFKEYNNCTPCQYKKKLGFRVFDDEKSN